ncbi:hypothetical protein ACYOEI_08930 [Singulisphaera rosea]
MDFVAQEKRWVWLYSDEAKSLRFSKSLAQIEEGMHPIVIGAFFLRANESLILDLRSCERALLAIPFFDKHLPRRVVELKEAEIVNRLFSGNEANLKLTPTNLFDSQTSTGVDTEALVRRLMESAAESEDAEEKFKVLTEDLRSMARNRLPEIERIPLHYAEEGIGGFQLAVRLRQMVALEHWLGNHEYTIDDAMQSSLRGL